MEARTRQRAGRGARRCASGRDLPRSPGTHMSSVTKPELRRNDRPVPGVLTDSPHELHSVIGNVGQLARQCRRADAGRLRPHGRARQRGRQGAGLCRSGAMWRSNYDMPPEEFAAETERMWQEVKPLYDSAPHLCPAQAEREVRRRRPAQDRPDPRRPARQYVGAGMGQYLPAGRAAGRGRYRL
jgi:hypothetical protein